MAFERDVELRPYAMDATLVTNAQYARFLAAAGYKPREPESFLKHWIRGAPPAGLEDHPVVYVDLEDTRAYARWAGKRLPLEEEWQLRRRAVMAAVIPGRTDGTGAVQRGRIGQHNTGNSVSQRPFAVRLL
jgi:formylglycine-generating enzyme required for sulfatase activity